MQINHTPSVRFQSLQVNAESFHETMKEQGVAQEKSRAFYQAENIFSDDFKYLRDNYNTDIAVSVSNRDGARRYHTEFVERGDFRDIPEKRIRAGWNYTDTTPKDVVNNALREAHRYYGQKTLRENEFLKEQVEELREGSSQLQDSIGKLLKNTSDD